MLTQQVKNPTKIVLFQCIGPKSAFFRFSYPRESPGGGCSCGGRGGRGVGGDCGCERSGRILVVQ